MASCKRVLHFLHAQEYYNAFLLRWLFAWVGCIPVARNGRDVGPVRLALRKLQQGWVLGVFPEGEVYAGEHMHADRAKSGAALLALRSCAPVFPARISGGPQGRSLLQAWLRPSTSVRVHFGPRIDLRRFYGRPITHRLLKEVTDLFMARIDALGSVEQRGVLGSHTVSPPCGGVSGPRPHRGAQVSARPPSILARQLQTSLR
jgi:1-acyl-sn-glycerol-3-phosphate acyltransferase